MAVHLGTLCQVCRREEEVLTSCGDQPITVSMARTRQGALPRCLLAWVRCCSRIRSSAFVRLIGSPAYRGAERVPQAIIANPDRLVAYVDDTAGVVRT
jgi:hypothetical protein